MKLVWITAQTLYLFAPLLVSVVLSAVVHRWNLFPRSATPIDGGATLGGRRVFGDGKTWRGVLIAVLGSSVAVACQKYVVASRAGSVAVIDYATANPIVLGSAIGGGAMLGELPNSFVKRQVGIARGETSSQPALRALFWIWDQIDLLTGAWPLLTFWLRPRLDLVAASVVLTLIIHPFVALVGYLLGARRSAR